MYAYTWRCVATHHTQGLIPWRIIDTYRTHEVVYDAILRFSDILYTLGILKIWRCKNLTRKLRQKAGLPLLYDEDDLPDPMYDPNYVHVLSEEQEKELHHRRWSFLDGVFIVTLKFYSDQKQFMKSQTWYRPHGTPTHRVSVISHNKSTQMLIKLRLRPFPSSKHFSFGFCMAILIYILVLRFLYASLLTGIPSSRSVMRSQMMLPLIPMCTVVYSLWLHVGVEQVCYAPSSISSSWAMLNLDRFERPAWTTGSLIPASFLCGIFSAVFIWRGSQKTRRTKEVEERLRLALTLEKHPDKFRAVEAAKATGQNMVNPSVPGNRSRTEAEAARANSPDKSHRISSIYIEEKMEVPPDADSR